MLLNCDILLSIGRDVVIGNAMVKGISGGQAKRTNIGIALITNPRVLFLDEVGMGRERLRPNRESPGQHGMMPFDLDGYRVD
jgi:ABC-type transporter Mla maintaining outer membrane lipid asymmetry ATPase subunit MlaF